MLKLMNRNSKAGFTLLELLISIVLLGVIVIIIGGAMRLGFRSVESGEEKSDSLERIRSSLHIIDSQIQSLILISPSYDEEKEEESYFQGYRESLQFSTNYSIWGGQKGYVVVTYRVEPDDQGKQILYASEKIVVMEDSRETKLLDNFDAIYFEYFYKDPTEEVGEWVEQWTDENNIPERIKLHLVNGEKDLSMIIPTRIGGSMIQTPFKPFGEEE